jgi:glucose-6-phosphate isomerase
MKLHFAGANTDPDELAAILSRLDLKKTAVNIISKSGDTV